jgi:hypothetical protein
MRVHGVGNYLQLTMKDGSLKDFRRCYSVVKQAAEWLLISDGNGFNQELKQDEREQQPEGSLLQGERPVSSQRSAVSSKG